MTKEKFNLMSDIEKIDFIDNNNDIDMLLELDLDLDFLKMIINKENLSNNKKELIQNEIYVKEFDFLDEIERFQYIADKGIPIETIFRFNLKSNEIDFILKAYNLKLQDSLSQSFLLKKDNVELKEKVKKIESSLNIKSR